MISALRANPDLFPEVATIHGAHIHRGGAPEARRRHPLIPRPGRQPVKSLMVVVGPLFLTDAIPVARLASEAYIWLLPMI